MSRLNEHFILLSTVGILLLVPSARAMDFGSYSRDCAANGGTAYKQNGVYQCNFSGGNAGNNEYDDGAAQREKAEAAAAEAQRQEQQRLEDAARRAREEAERQRQFIEDRDETAATLKGSSSSSLGQLRGLGSESDTTQLKGSFDSNTQSLKGSEPTKEVTKKACPTVTDSSVVDACNVPSELPKAIDNAISAVYASAQAGVSDRVRKGFQAVIVRDWNVAKAWFEDALNHDPGNANLKKFVELSNYTENHISQSQEAKTFKLSAKRTAVQPPKDSDIELLFFPGWEPPARSNTAKREPTEEDLVFLFPGIKFNSQKDRVEARKLSDLMMDEAIKMTENDPVLLRVSNRPMPGKTVKHSSSGIHN